MLYLLLYTYNLYSTENNIPLVGIIDPGCETRHTATDSDVKEEGMKEDTLSPSLSTQVTICN